MVLDDIRIVPLINVFPREFIFHKERRMGRERSLKTHKMAEF